APPAGSGVDGAPILRPAPDHRGSFLQPFLHPSAHPQAHPAPDRPGFRLAWIALNFSDLQRNYFRVGVLQCRRCIDMSVGKSLGIILVIRLFLLPAVRAAQRPTSPAAPASPSGSTGVNKPYKQKTEPCWEQ